MEVTSLRFSQEWIQRGQSQVLALRSTFSFGLDLWNSTDNGVAGDPNGTYVAWLGQAQYIRRLFRTQNQLVLRWSEQADELEAAVDEWAGRLAVAPTRALALTKALVNRSLDSDRATAFAEEANAQEMNMSTADANEGVAAFVERRSPTYRGW